MLAYGCHGTALSQMIALYTGWASGRLLIAFDLLCKCEVVPDSPRRSNVSTVATVA